MSFHDPNTQADYIRQSLSHDKRPIGLFLGAGCPVSINVDRSGTKVPLIPNIAGMTAHVNGVMSASPQKKVYETVLSHFVEDGIGSPNVELLLSHIRFLKQVAGKDQARGVSADQADKLDIAICDELAKLASETLPYPDTPYHQLAAWTGSINRAFPVEFFTTNYDLLLEEALEANRVPFFDGFVGSKASFLDLQAMEADALPPRWARVWKIHGSLNWGEDKNGNIHRGANPGPSRRLIYPSHLKYDQSRRMPYLAMLDRLRAFLKQPASVLIICGFSFGDDHLNEIIIQGLQGNATAAVFALMYGPLGSYPKLIELARNRGNLSVLAFDQAVIGTRQGEWPKGKPPGFGQNSMAVQWIDDPAASGTLKSVFLLPDFRALAAFAADLVGQQRYS